MQVICCLFGGTELLELRCLNCVVKENVEDCRPKGIRYNVTFVEDILYSDLFPAIRSKLFASLKGFPLLSGVLYSAERINPKRKSPFGIHPRSGPVPSGFIHKVELLFLLRNAYCVIGTTLLICRRRPSQRSCPR